MSKKTKTIKKKLAKSEPKKKLISFAVDSSPAAETGPLSMEAMNDTIRLNMGLQKAVKPNLIEKGVKGKYSQSKVVFATRSYTSNPDNTLQKGYQRLSDAELRQLAMMDPYISAIVTTRVSQGGACGQPSDNKFDKGVRIEELDPLKYDDFENDEEYEKERNKREGQMRNILKWVLNCGTTDKDVLNYAFRGADPTFKRCSLKDYIQAQTRNLLTFGRIGAQKFKNAEGVTVMFRPVPIETISPVEYTEKVYIGKNEETAKQSLEDVQDYNALPDNDRPEAWVQRINGENVNFFSEDDMSIWYYQKQALFDLNGYPLAPIEMAIYMTFIHQQTLGYLRNQFIKGLATKGIIALESTNPNVQLSDADLEDFKQQFHNFVSRTDNSAVTPVIGGPVKVQWTPLTVAPKDMEFLQVEEHVIRALCSAFQISPQEMGFGHLSLPQGGLTQANKQEDIIKGEERGLRMILDVIFEGINEIVFENFPDAQKLYRVTYVGVGEDTREAVVERSTAELATTATMSSLFADSEKKENIPLGGDVPLSDKFHGNVVRYMKYGVFMEKFFGMEGWSEKPEYDFIIDPTLNQSYMALKTQPVKEQKAAFEMQLEAQAQQMQMAEQQMGMAQQQQAQGQDAQQQQAQQPQPQPEQQGGEEMAQSEKPRVSLLEKYKSLKAQDPLEKSVKSYFQEWIKAGQELQ